MHFQRFVRDNNGGDAGEVSEAKHYRDKSPLYVIYDLLRPNGGVLHPSSKPFNRWIQWLCVFFILSLIIDPLFFFNIYVNPTDFCTAVDWRLAKGLTACRTVIDFFFLVHILVTFRTAYVEKSAKIDSWWPAERSHVPCCEPGEIVSDRREISRNYLRGWFSVDVLSMLPLPQLLLLLLNSSETSSSEFKNVIRIVVMLQFIPRFIRLLPYLTGDAFEQGFLFESSYSNFLLNLSVYFVISHIFGCMWILLATSRVGRCLRQICATEASFCNTSFMDCTAPSSTNRTAWINSTSATTDCFSGTNSYFQYGIYDTAVPFVIKTFSIDKYAFSFFWGFQQLSTLAGNQVPSSHFSEIAFIVLVTLCGLLLFSLLIGNIQTFLTSLTQRAFDYQVKRQHIEVWMTLKDIPKDLKSRVREFYRLSWKASYGISDSDVMDSLPEGLQVKLTRHIASKLISNSRLLKDMEDRIVDVLCLKLRRRVFLSDSELLKQGYPVGQVYFIESGEAMSIKVGGDYTSAFFREYLGKGSCVGEELFISTIENSISNINQKKKETDPNSENEMEGILPVSERTVKCISSVVCFALDAADLQKFCNQFHASFRNHKMTKLLNEVSHIRRQHAATTIQIVWRQHLRKKYKISLKELLNAKTRGDLGRLYRDLFSARH